MARLVSHWTQVNVSSGGSLDGSEVFLFRLQGPLTNPESSAIITGPVASPPCSGQVGGEERHHPYPHRFIVPLANSVRGHRIGSKVAEPR